MTDQDGRSAWMEWIADDQSDCLEGRGCRLMSQADVVEGACGHEAAAAWIDVAR